MTAPLYEHLRKYASQNRISFAMPGHKNGRGLKRDLVSLDVTELAATENLYHGGEYVREANRLLAKLYGSDESFILTGGSTAAIQAMISGAVKRGGTLLAAADCHQSVINACTLLGINIRFIPKEIDCDFSVPLGTDTIEGFITPDTDAVIITSPNYYGICSNIKRIALDCHEKGIPLLVDEAHGAHFIGSGFPVTAVQYADAVCHSAHKTLNAMNGAAYLHLCGKYIDRERAKKAITMFQSTSPSYVIAATADTARAELEKGDMWKTTRELCESFRRATANIGVSVLPNDDVTRIVLNFSGFQITGYEVESILSQSGIDIEMADMFNIVLIVTPANTKDEMRSLWWTILNIAENVPKRENTIGITAPPVCTETLNPSDAFWSEGEEIALNRSEGRIAKGTVTPYPPGVPVIVTGERIRREQIEYLEEIEAAGGEINGLNDGKIEIVK
ncbi:MAG: aminotransferase class V-fold PLP-dependent enzyme [Clostridia bacterium]|nr:aminotransferase class V-fold PLP-dependent enzyme [Clostridia bacterium]